MASGLTNEVNMDLTLFETKMGKPNLEFIALDLLPPDEELTRGSDPAMMKTLDLLGGIIQPVVLIKKSPAEFKLICGESRVVNLRKAGHREVMALVYSKDLNAEHIKAVLQLVENHVRSHNPRTDWQALSKLVFEQGRELTDIAESTGVKIQTLQAVMRLNGLIPELRERFMNREFSFTLAKKIANRDSTFQEELAALDKITSDIYYQKKNEQLKKSKPLFWDEPGDEEYEDPEGEAIERSSPAPAIGDALLQTLMVTLPRGATVNFTIQNGEFSGLISTDNENYDIQTTNGLTAALRDAIRHLRETGNDEVF